MVSIPTLDILQECHFVVHVKNGARTILKAEKFKFK